MAIQPESGAAMNQLALHQPVGLPLVTNGPDNAKPNANNDVYRRGRFWGQPPV
jgi:hypothetical protein